MVSAVSPDEVYVAFGTEKGTIYVFETKLVGSAQPYFHLSYQTHRACTSGLKFIQFADNFLLASFDKDNIIKVQCLKDNVPLYSNASIPDIKILLYSERAKALITTSKDFTVSKISLNFDNEFLEGYANKFENDLELNMKRTFLRVPDDETRQAITQHFSDFDILGLQKINMFSITAAIGKSRALGFAATRFDMWMTPQGETLVQICNQTNDVDCIDICLQKIAEGKGSMNWETLCQII